MEACALQKLILSVALSTELSLCGGNGLLKTFFGGQDLFHWLQVHANNVSSISVTTFKTEDMFHIFSLRFHLFHSFFRIFQWKVQQSALRHQAWKGLFLNLYCLPFLTETMKSLFQLQVLHIVGQQINFHLFIQGSVAFVQL